MTDLLLSLWKGEIPARKTADAIIDEVTLRRQMSRAEMFSPSRRERCVHARWEAMHDLYTTQKPNGSRRSTPEIGRIFGMDHTSVLYGIKRWARIVAEQQAASQ